MAKHSEFWKVIKEIAGFALPGLVVPTKSNANTSCGFPAAPPATTSLNIVLNSTTPDKDETCGFLPQRHLTRRANHWHIFSIAAIEPAPGTGRGLFESGGGCRHISLVPPYFRCPLCRAGLKEIAMKRALVAVVIAGSLFSFEASAQERAGSAALGAVSGAIVLGPIGAVAGAFIGYSAGPAIAHSWGGGRSASHSRVRREAQTTPATQQQAAVKVSSPPSVKAPETVATGKTAPPVQGFD